VLIKTGQVFQGSGAVLLDQVYDGNMIPLTQSTVTNINVLSTDLSTNTQIATGTLAVNSTMLNAFTVTPLWTSDTIGYNSAGNYAGTYWPTANTVVQLEVIYTLEGGETEPSVWHLTVLPLYSQGGD
jgi:hypothetical protein